ncbi:HTH-type transcriptional activator IlvY [Dongshaea marina]|uniref:HTH-type transcriptional activator IlvY n=1 Tax=Dongshaea marina TaxID=2047966 RepID=UPI000D3E13F2|nr:HTH-type transcriptional activator IlvY [Dongshaea marina]
MNLKLLHQFIHLCDSRHFGKTARAMHISPSALSRSIARLEESLGHPLFVRDNRQVTLTLAGKQLLPVAQSMLEQWQQLRGELAAHSQQLSGELRFYCSVTASHSYLPPLLGEFRLNCPGVSIKLMTGDPALAIRQVIEDRCDMAITARPRQLPDKLAFNKIGDIPLMMLAPLQPAGWAELLQQQPTPWDHLPMILPESGAAREHIDEWLSRQEVEPRIYAEVAGHEAIISMVALGTGVGIAPEVVLNASPVRDRVVRLDAGFIEPFELGICCLKSRLNEPLIQAMWQLA